MDRTRPIRLLVAVVGVVLALGGPVGQAATAKQPSAPAVPGELLIGFRDDVSAADQTKILRGLGATEKKSFKKIHGSLAHVTPDAVATALAKLHKDPRVRYAHPNVVVHAD